MEHLFFFSGSITTFFLVLLLSKKNKAAYDKLLIIWFAIILFHIAVFYLSSFDQYTYLLELSSAAVFLSGPILWLYTRQLTRNSDAIRWNQGIHLLPFLINIAIVLPYVLQGSLAPLSDFSRDLLAWGKLASILLYCLAAIAEIRQHKTVAKENYSNIESIHLKWLQFVIFGIIGIWVIGLASQLIFQTSQSSFPEVYEDVAVNVAVSCLVIFIGYYGFVQAPIFIIDSLKQPIGKTAKVSDPEETPAVAIKYKRSGIGTEAVVAHARKLERLMSGHKPFTDPELTLDKLAAFMEISPNQLSQIINEHYRQSFYDFVNAYRVEEVKELLKTNAVEHTTLLGIGLNAGFNSKATFNRCFKKHTGKTPSDYLKEIHTTS
jgi:AraC-like DNA-binding protein